MVKEISDSDIETTYVYSDVGTLCKKSIDIYNYYYENNGQCDKIDIMGKPLLIMITRFQTRMFWDYLGWGLFLLILQDIYMVWTI